MHNICCHVGLNLGNQVAVASGTGSGDFLCAGAHDAFAIVSLNYEASENLVMHRN